MANRYTQSWQKTYLRPDSPMGPQRDKTQIQVEFLMDQLPLPGYRRVLDVCCGLGRHAIPLAESGYEVLGVDRDPQLITEAGAEGSSAHFRQLDMRNLSELDEQFDAVICMWQSFGYFSHKENEAVFRSMVDRLRPGGRLVLDLYNRQLFDAPGSSSGREHRTAGTSDWAEQSIYDKDTGVLHVSIEWASGERDDFVWQLYAPDEIATMGVEAGLQPGLQCADFNPRQRPDNGRKSFQVVFEKK